MSPRKQDHPFTGRTPMHMPTRSHMDRHWELMERESSEEVRGAMMLTYLCDEHAGMRYPLLCACLPPHCAECRHGGPPSEEDMKAMTEEFNDYKK